MECSSQKDMEKILMDSLWWLTVTAIGPVIMKDMILIKRALSFIWLSAKMELRLDSSEACRSGCAVGAAVGQEQRCGSAC